MGQVSLYISGILLLLIMIFIGWVIIKNTFTNYNHHINIPKENQNADMDIEMNDKLCKELLFYARQNILNDEDTLLNWAFVKALEKGIKRFEQEVLKETEHAYCLICRKEIPPEGKQVCLKCTERAISHLF